MCAWEPVLEGAIADEARGVILDIARGVARGEGSAPKAHDAILFWAYVAGAFDDDWIAEAYDAAVAALADEATAGFVDPSLYYGAAGTGFAIAHVSEPGTVDDSLAAIDQTLLGALETSTNDFDLIGGLAGIAVYFLERSDVARRGLDRTIERLLAIAEPGDDGPAWITADGYDLGVAHGVPGVAAVLARAAVSPGADPRWRTIAEQTLAWMRARCDANGHYPARIARGQRSGPPTRTAWCYGDPGVAIATYGACARLGLPTGDALALARDCASRPFEQTSVEDAGFCHGAAGLAHIYNRLYQASGDSALRDGARAWFRRVLDMRRPDGVGGYPAWIKRGDAWSWAPVTTIIMGATGVALALLAAIEPTPPSWDRMFLCDLP